jgi:hypothetical protein
LSGEYIVRKIDRCIEVAVLFVSTAGATGVAWVPARAGVITPDVQRTMVARLENRPIVFFLAKGPANSCGPGCSEWIAAEGRIDPGAAQRFRDFLAKLPRYDLPVYFHSRGGFGQDAVEIARTLRQHRMTAAIGRTVTERCRVFALQDGACQALVKSGAAIKSHLAASEGRCMSACVHAFAGGSIRHVPPGAQLGIHSARTLDNPKGARDRSADERAKVAMIHRTLRLHLVHMGIDPTIEDTAEKVSAARLYVLSREEIARAGFETMAAYETHWALINDSKDRLFALKAITRQEGLTGDHDYRTTVLSLSCHPFSGLWLGYRRELAGAEVFRYMSAQLVAGDMRKMLARGSEKDGAATWSQFVTFDQLDSVASLPALEFTMGGSGTGHVAPLRLRTVGLTEALQALRKRCPPAAVPATTAAAPVGPLQAAAVPSPAVPWPGGQRPVRTVPIYGFPENVSWTPNFVVPLPNQRPASASDATMISSGLQPRSVNTIPRRGAPPGEWLPGTSH